jgi:hypothetical protein
LNELALQRTKSLGDRLLEQSQNPKVNNKHLTKEATKLKTEIGRQIETGTMQPFEYSSGSDCDSADKISDSEEQ